MSTEQKDPIQDVNAGPADVTKEGAAAAATPKEGEEIADPLKDPNAAPQEEPPADEDDAPEDPLAFYQEVNKLTGVERKWEFPEGIDPMSPQGVHHAFKEIEKDALDNWERFLQQTNPRAYAYLLHSENGGSDEEFFARKTETLPDWELLKDSVDLQSKFYTRILTSKGLDEDHIKLLVKDAQDKKKLLPLVEAEYKKSQREQQEMIDRLQQESERQEKVRQQDVNQTASRLRSHILENKDLNIVIPDAKRAEFLQFVSDRVSYDKSSRKMFIEQELGENTPRVLEALFFLFSGGDLSQLIAAKAKDQTAARMRLGFKKEKPVGSKEGPPRDKDIKPGVRPPISTL